MTTKDNTYGVFYKQTVRKLMEAFISQGLHKDLSDDAEAMIGRLLIGTEWRHGKNHIAYRITSLSWMGERDEWGIEHAHFENDKNEFTPRTFVRSVSNFFEASPNFIEMEATEANFWKANVAGYRFY